MYNQLIYTHSLKNEITGTKKEVSDIYSDDLMLLYKHFYQSSQRQLIIYGPIDVEKYQSILENFPSKTGKVIDPIIIPQIEHKAVKDKRTSLSFRCYNIALGLKYVLIMKKHCINMKLSCYF